MKKVIIIAEAGVNHNADINKAKQLIDVAAESGADYVKFQTAVPHLVVTKGGTMADYQIQNLGLKESQLEMTKKIHLPLSDFEYLAEYAHKKNIKFASTPFDLLSIDTLSRLNMDFFKIPSGEITNYPYLVKIAKIGIPIILSTGMATIEEIKDAVKVLTDNGVSKDKITILHCNTEYPTPMEDVNLKAMLHIQREIGVSVGYSDHTLGIEVPIAAVALGAEVIEKHFTLDKNMEGPDHNASLNPEELKLMVKSIRNIEKALGNGIKKPNKSEELIKKVVRRRIIIAKDLEKGHILSEEDLEYKRANNGIEVEFYESVLGKKLVYSKSKEDILEWREIENAN